MQICFEKEAWKDYLYWQKKDKAILKRINLLIQDMMRSPFDGIGKPEQLKDNLSGLYSRRINEEHRLIYAVFGDRITISQCRYHY